MPSIPSQWHVLPPAEIPQVFTEALKPYTPSSTGQYAAQLLWQRGIQNREQLPGFLDPQAYQPSSPFEFGQEMKWAIQRLIEAGQRQEKVTIWGDFDADGITATSVLWEGLGQFLPQQEQLSYYIPNRLTESHGLNDAGIERLAEEGMTLIVTCDTGSTNIREIDRAKTFGIDVIVTDHHALPPERPNGVAIINPRYFAENHPLFHLSGVAVAYKLVEAMYATQPEVPQQPLEDLLDLVAIGLIADLVELRGDCRYLAQRGIAKLQQQTRTPTRPGVAKLLELCQRSGDRPTDISFGLGPRINAVSRIHGDARFCVELLTSRDNQHCHRLALEAELANTRRKELQKNVAQSVRRKLEQLDLSTTGVIVLEDPQWSGGVLGLVAGQVAQEYGRPTVLLTTGEGRDEEAEMQGSSVEQTRGCGDAETRRKRIRGDMSREEEAPGLMLQPSGFEPVFLERGDRMAAASSGDEQEENSGIMAKGSARSVNGIDLYELVKTQEHLLHRFGGHPFAAGLSLLVENLPLFRDAVNQQLRATVADLATMRSRVQADLTVTVAELGQNLFRELKLLEPCGMGNPVPKLLIQNCWFTDRWNRNAKDIRGKKVQYIKTTFTLCDDSGPEGFPGVWWGHYKDELPQEQGCDAIVELDYNTYHRRYEARLIAVRPQQRELNPSLQSESWIVDWRGEGENGQTDPAYLCLDRCPMSWNEVYQPFRTAIAQSRPLALAYDSPFPHPPQTVWNQLVGIAKYLSRTGDVATPEQLRAKLPLSPLTLQQGLKALENLGFEVQQTPQGLHCRQRGEPSDRVEDAIAAFLALVEEEQFQRQYFYNVPLGTVEAFVAQANEL